MVISNKKKGGSSKSKNEQKVNPFELKFNKVKHNVLGKKKNKNEGGRPGLSKKKAFAFREQTLGAEYQQFGKTNKVVDKRIGAKDENITEEEKASLRFTAERLKNFKKVSKFNLVDDDDIDLLTHGGKALTDIQKYDKTIMSDDEDDGAGNLGADIVTAAHFGSGTDETGRKSRKDAIAELIAKTKQARQEKAMAKDEIENITDNLDQKFTQLLGKMQKTFRPVGATKNEKSEKDDYDTLAFTLKLDSDARATPAERLKTEEELAAEEMSNLEDLENQRIARMNTEKNKNTHISADIDVGELVSSKKDKKSFVVRFDSKGELIGKNKVEKASITKVAIDSDDELSDEDDEEDNEEELDDLMDEEDEDEDEEEGEEEDEEEDNETPISKKGMRANLDQVLLKTGTNTSIPFVFDMPKNLKELSAFIKKYLSDLNTVFERLIKCHHPGLKEGNKKLLAKLFLLILRYFDDVTINQEITKENLTVVGVLINVLYRLMKYDIDYGVRCVRALIRQHWKLRSEKDRQGPPSFGVVALMRMVSSLYPASDRWHPVCTPSFTLACLTLSNVLISSLSILARQIMLVTVLGDFVEESKRYIPEAIAFLQGTLLLAVKHDESERSPSNVFPISLPHREILYISEPMDKNTDIQPIALGEIYNQGKSSESLLEDNSLNRCRVLRSAIGIIQKYRILYAVHEHSFQVIFSPILNILKRIPVENLPTSLSEEIEILIKSMEAECKSRSRLTQLSNVKTEKSMLKMLEPEYEWDFDPERPKRSNDKNEKRKLQHVYKREMRGAVKELRKDAVYLGRKQRKDTYEKDKDRKQKTKRLLQGLQTQQADWNREKWENAPKKKKKF